MNKPPKRLQREMDDDRDTFIIEWIKQRKRKKGHEITDKGQCESRLWDEVVIWKMCCWLLSM